MKNKAKKIFATKAGREIAYSWHEGHGEPLLFLNGLSEPLETWHEVLHEAKLSRPYLLVDLPGQGESFARELKSGQDLSYRLTMEEQVSGLVELLDELSIGKFGVVGFSYGGGVALGLAASQAERLTDLVLLSPFILRLDLSFPMSRLWAAQFEFMKALTPKAWRHPYEVAERSYEKFIENYMNYRYIGRIPDDHQRRVAIALSRGIMEFNSFAVIGKLPDDKLVLITSGKDSLVPGSLYDEFWQRLPENKKRAWVKVQEAEHLLLEQAPHLVAQLLHQALKRTLTGVSEVKGWPPELKTLAAMA